MISDEEEFILRRLLAVRYAGAVLYTDDGELEDNYEVPFIDFLRDLPSEIETKIYQRHLNQQARLGTVEAVSALINQEPSPAA